MEYKKPGSKGAEWGLTELGRLGLVHGWAWHAWARDESNEASKLHRPSLADLLGSPAW